MKIYAIIPCRNECETLPATIKSLAASYAAFIDRTCELTIVVADCHSPDGTANVAKALIGDIGVPLLVEEGDWRNRAQALNGGAKAVLKRLEEGGGKDEELELGEIVLWWVHADSLPHAQSLIAIAKIMENGAIWGGAFSFQFQKANETSQVTRFKLQCVTLLNRLRYSLTGIYYGDQGIFVRASAYVKVGGFEDRPLMEDIHFCKKLRKLGKLSLVKLPMRTSPRRFLRHGVLKQSLVDIFLLLCDRLHFEPSRLHHWYNREKS